MSHDDEQCLKLGREVLRMMRELIAVTDPGNSGYGKRKVTFPGGSLFIILATDQDVLDIFERVMQDHYAVNEVIPKSEVM